MDGIWRSFHKKDYSPASTIDPDDVEHQHEPETRTVRTDTAAQRWTHWQKLAIFLVIFGLVSLEVWEHAIPSHPSHRSLSQSPCQSIAIRREWRALTADERDDFVRSVKCLSTVPSRWMHNGTVYDDFAYLHGSIGKWCHHSASFLPWHRWTLHIWEASLREHCGFRGHVPYWDWTRDWMDIAASSIWDAESGFGGNGDPTGQVTVGNGTCVEDGPFANLRPIRYNNTYVAHCLSRGFADKPTLDRLLGKRFNPRSIGRIMRVDDYKDFNWEAEFHLHNGMHPAIGGDFLAMTAANDPIFFLHHAQLDHIWWQWQQQQPESRLSAYSGRHMVNSTDENASLQDVLMFGGLVENVPVWHAMDTENGKLCYRY
ncbi:tyrosinase tyrosinase: common central domain protein [Zymoseptoria brevis]|uniref:Tyrosinase tyrosinase: common central domain protein n=1 Tax=Zymoseptoria brevis TaxID=1047168 RepID=A0A0F4GR75_9PEZI|nr:tyrosinase tyrosinase: common central domain protein [Zymoseptoria brevis]